MKEESISQHQEICDRRPYDYVCAICHAIFPGIFKCISENFKEHIFQAHENEVIFLQEVQDNTVQIQFEDKAKLVIRYAKEYLKNQYYWIKQINKEESRQIIIQELFVSNNNVLKTYEIKSNESELIFLGNICSQNALEENLFSNCHEISRLSLSKGPIIITFHQIMAVPKELLKSLECPVCHDLMKTKILLCDSGHSICSKCSKHLDSCPLCKNHISNEQRNFSLESAIHVINTECPNFSRGCLEEILSSNINQHLSQCLFNPLTCPNCKIEVNYTNFSEHLLNHCKMETQIYAINNLLAVSDQLFIVNSFHQTFILNFKNIDDEQCLIISQLTQNKSELFNFQIKLFRFAESFKQNNIIDKCSMYGDESLPIALSDYTHIKFCVFKME